MLRTIVLTEYIQPPTEITTRVIIGRIACQIKSNALPSESLGGGALNIPPRGRTLSPIEKTSMKIIPAHQLGSAFDAAERKETVRSSLLPTLTARRTPTRRPMTAVIPRAVVTSAMVLGSLSRTRSEIFELPAVVLSV